MAFDNVLPKRAWVCLYGDLGFYWWSTDVNGMIERASTINHHKASNKPLVHGSCFQGFSRPNMAKHIQKSSNTAEVGLTPYNSPGALCLLAGTDLTDGVWYPMGGVERWNELFVGSQLGFICHIILKSDEGVGEVVRSFWCIFKRCKTIAIRGMHGKHSTAQNQKPSFGQTQPTWT